MALKRLPKCCMHRISFQSQSNRPPETISFIVTLPACTLPNRSQGRNDRRYASPTVFSTAELKAYAALSDAPPGSADGKPDYLSSGAPAMSSLKPSDTDDAPDKCCQAPPAMAIIGPRSVMRRQTANTSQTKLSRHLLKLTAGDNCDRCLP